MDQYNLAYSNGLVAEGALVIITEVNVTPGGGSGSGGEGDNSGTTTAKLGFAVLGQMKLGQE
jgi:ribulose 1,5-bisphosphate synthetase/thiazole synthase